MKWEFHYSLPPLPNNDCIQLTEDLAERHLLKQLSEAKDNTHDAVWELAQFYKARGSLDMAMHYFQHLLENTSDLEKKAEIVLALGQTAEKLYDYEMAASIYRQALMMEPADSSTWYFILNNLGFSLNQLTRFSESEGFCRNAISINPCLPNAHKNLGVALMGQGRYRNAAECFITSTKANASDPRALGHLEELLKVHQELICEFADQLELCRQSVMFAEQERDKAQAEWHAKRNLKTRQG